MNNTNPIVSLANVPGNKPTIKLKADAILAPDNHNAINRVKLTKSPI